jgi:general secretion pathway protein D
MRRGGGFPYLFALAAVAMAAGCQSASPPPHLAPLQEPASLQPAAPRVNGTIPNEFSQQHAYVAPGVTEHPTVAAPPPGAAASAGGDVTLDFVDADIREIAHTILGNMLKVNYTIDPDVKGTASIETGKPISRAALLPILETLLNQNGATVVKKDGVYRVTLIGPGAVSNVIAGGGALGAGTQVVALHYASADQLAKVLKPYVSGSSKIDPDPAGNALIVSGDASARTALVSLIHAFDIDLLAGQSYALFPAGDADPQKLAKEIEKVMQAEQGQPLEGVVRVLPMNRVDAVLVISSQPSYINAARRLLRLAHNVEDATARTWHVYYVQNGQALELQNLLQRAFTPEHVTPLPTAAPGTTAPGAPTAISTTGSPSGLGQTGTPAAGGTSTGGIGALPGAGGGTPTSSGAAAGMTLAQTSGGTGPTAGAGGASATSAATEPLSAETGGEGKEAANRIRIIADPRNNALMVYATPTEYSVIEGMLRKVDIIPLQVLISATIAEVTLNDNLQYGTQWYARIGGASAFLTQTGTALFNQSFTPNTFVIGKNQSFVLNALADITTVKVLSAPQIMVLDNQPASLQVGQQVPVLTGQATSTLTTGTVVNTVDYHNTGVIMLVTPRVNSGGLVTLDIAQEVSDVAAAATNTVQNSPTFDDQVFRTRLAVQDGQTVGMAGLIHDNVSEANSGLPFLKDIPVLGTFFSNQNNTRARSELLVMITPHVVHDQRDARALTEDLRSQLINAGLLPQELQAKPPTGSANPNGL